MKYFLSFLLLLLSFSVFSQTPPRVVHRASTAVTTSGGSTLGNLTYASLVSDTQINLKTSNLSTATDGILNETTIEIRVYP